MGRVPGKPARGDTCRIPAPRPDSTPEPEPAPEPAGDPFYQLFLRRLHEEAAGTPLGLAELHERLALTRSQLSDWLRRAEQDGEVEKLTRPVRYRAVPGRQASLGF